MEGNPHSEAVLRRNPCDIRTCVNQEGHLPEDPWPVYPDAEKYERCCPIEETIHPHEGCLPEQSLVLHDENIVFVRDEIDQEIAGVAESFFQGFNEGHEVLMGGDHLLVFHGDELLRVLLL